MEEAEVKRINDMKVYQHQDALAPDEIFVFGSNTAGIHGAGAARDAKRHFEAKHGVGEGPTGRCYAIPTKDHRLSPRTLEEIKSSVDAFIAYSRRHPRLRFIVTPIGCGLAGFRPADIAPMFSEVPENVFLPEEFKSVLSRG